MTPSHFLLGALACVACLAHGGSARAQAPAPPAPRWAARAEPSSFDPTFRCGAAVNRYGHLVAPAGWRLAVYTNPRLPQTQRYDLSSQRGSRIECAASGHYEGARFVVDRW